MNNKNGWTWCTPAVGLIMCFVFKSGGVQGQACHGGQADLYFLLDSSGSVGSNNFQVMKTFAQNITKALDIGTDTVRVGVIKFGNLATAEFDLDDYTNMDAVSQSIGDVKYKAGQTYTNKALKLMREEGFITSAGGREGRVPRIGIVITDGNSTDRDQTAKEAAMVHTQFIVMVAVGVGNPNYEELRTIATDPDTDNVFHVTHFSNLNDVEADIAARACIVSKSPPCQTALCQLLSGGAQKSNGRTIRAYDKFTLLVFGSVMVLMMI